MKIIILILLSLSLNAQTVQDYIQQTSNSLKDRGTIVKNGVEYKTYSTSYCYITASIHAAVLIPNSDTITDSLVRAYNSYFLSNGKDSWEDNGFIISLCIRDDIQYFTIVKVQ